MNNIPKIIHYCWFGKKEKTDSVKKMIETWKHTCPEYEIMEWNEENFNIHMNKYTEQAYENKKYAFVSDVARLYALLHVGGVYMDTDVEVIKNLDEILVNDMVIGFQDDKNINTGFIASKKDNQFIKKLIKEYNNRNFIKKDGTLDTKTNVRTITDLLIENGLKLNNKEQNLDEIKIYPAEYFCPIDYLTGKKNITKNTYVIHWFESSWLPKKVKLKKSITRVIYRIFGKDCLNWLKRK